MTRSCKRARSWRRYGLSTSTGAILNRMECCLFGGAARNCRQTVRHHGLHFPQAFLDNVRLADPSGATPFVDTSTFIVTDRSKRQNRRLTTKQHRSLPTAPYGADAI